MKILRQAEMFGYRTGIALDDPNLTTPTKLYRGVAVMGVPPEQQQRWNDALDYSNWDGDKASLGKHLQVGPELIQHLQERQGGVGRHWTTNPARAYDFAGRSMENRNLDNPDTHAGFPAVLEMNWDGTGLDMSDRGMNSGSHNFDVDDERVLQGGHQVNISGVKVAEPDLGGWTDVLNPSPEDRSFDDFKHLHRPNYGHPGVI